MIIQISFLRVYELNVTLYWRRLVPYNYNVFKISNLHAVVPKTFQHEKKSVTNSINLSYVPSIMTHQFFLSVSNIYRRI